MKKLINTTLIFTIFIFSITACSPSEAATENEVVEPAEPTEATEEIAVESPTEEPAPTDEPAPDTNEAQGILDQLLVNPSLVFKENASEMADNEGGQFGFIEIKQFNEAENVFEFTSDSDGAYLRLNTLLDEFDENMEQGSSQGILIKFQPPANMNSFYFNFYGQNDSEFGVTFSNESKPSLFIFMEATMEPFDGELTLETGKTYYLLLALSSDGKVASAIWEEGNIENISTYIDDFSGRQGGENYQNSSRSFAIAFAANDTLKVSEYSIYTFDGIN